MKRIVVLGLLLCTIPALPQEKKIIKGKSEMKQLFLEQEKDNIVKTFPNLLILEQDFTDENNNKIIDANEATKIVFRIRNNGNGEATDVKVKVSMDGEPIRGLNFSELVGIGNIQSQETKEVAIPVNGSADLLTGQATFDVQVVEANGFDASPFTMTIKTHKLREPEIIIADAAFIADDGKNIRLNYPIILKVLVQNIGDGEATSVGLNFDFTKEKDNCVLLDDSEKRIGNLKPGEYQEVEFMFTATRRYTLQEIPIYVDLHESQMKYDRDTTLTASLNQDIHSGQLIAIEGREEEMGDITLGELDLGEQPPENLTMRGVGDPTKGLNVANVRKDMVIGDYYALIIGIDDYYGAFDPLNNAVRDAESIENILKAKYKFDHFITLYNRQATRIAILAAFEDLVNHVSPNDNVFIYYSGHGEYKQQLRKGYWVPVDARSNSVAELISNNDIQTFLTGIKSKHTLLVSDACFAGEIFRGEVMHIPYENSERYYRTVHERPSRKAITSGGIEPVMDSGLSGHSVFAYYFIRTLQDNNDPFYDASQLYERIKIPVMNNSEQQPFFRAIKNTGDEGGQFIFIQRF